MPRHLTTPATAKRIREGRGAGTVCVMDTSFLLSSLLSTYG